LPETISFAKARHNILLSCDWGVTGVLTACLTY